MAKYSSLPLFTDSWIADTAHLSRCERGLYMDLLILCWRSPRCRVPNEIDWIARKLTCSETEIETLKKVIAEFMSSTGNWLFQKRLLKEWKYIERQHRLQSDRAKAKQNKDKDSSRTEAGKKTRQPSGSAPSPSPSPSPSIKEDSLSAPGADETTPKKANGHSRLGTRLPENWLPNSDDCEVGYELGLTEDQIRFEHKKFTDFWRAKSGRDATKVDWNATFRNWLRNAHERKPRTLQAH